jgi:hypothetical protein
MSGTTAEETEAGPRGPLLPTIARRGAMVLVAVGLVLGAVAIVPTWQSLTHLLATPQGTLTVTACTHQNPLIYECSGTFTPSAGGATTAVRLVNDGHDLAIGARLPVGLSASYPDRAYETGLHTQVAAITVIGMAWFIAAIVGLARRNSTLTACALAAGAPLLWLGLVAVRF